jgi:methionyl-tRNA synthetase
MDYYITTSIPYINGDPHLGHSLEFVMADVLARYARKQGKSVIFSTGTDEHGTKNAQKAASLNLTPEDYADQVSGQFIDTLRLLDISNNRFIRTTSPEHENRAQQIWKNLSKDIYKAKYSGWYDVKQEEFVPDGQADPERMKPDHPQAYQKLEEENYFFKLSQYTDRIKQAIEQDELKILPATKRNEILSLLREGLSDISISRPKNKLEWGIAVPGDPSQVMYVWFEALMNYITVLGYPDGEDFKKYWPADVQVIGKDIIRFHAAIWPGMLMSLELPLPKLLFVHGFILIDGKAMSKSLGTGIHPKEIVDKYGADAFRYYFLRHIPSYNDGNFSWKTFVAAYDNELANGLGNAVQRTAVLIERYQSNVIGQLPDQPHDSGTYREALESCHFDQALDAVWDQVRGLNQYIDEEKPWVAAKSSDKSRLRELLAYQASCLLEIADMLEPFLPASALKIKQMFGDGYLKPIKGTLFPKTDSAEPKTP